MPGDGGGISTEGVAVVEDLSFASMNEDDAGDGSGGSFTLAAMEEELSSSSIPTTSNSPVSKKSEEADTAAVAVAADALGLGKETTVADVLKSISLVSFFLPPNHPLLPNLASPSSLAPQPSSTLPTTAAAATGGLPSTLATLLPSLLASPPPTTNTTASASASSTPGDEATPRSSLTTSEQLPPVTTSPQSLNIFGSLLAQQQASNFPLLNNSNLLMGMGMNTGLGMGLAMPSTPTAPAMSPGTKQDRLTIKETEKPFYFYKKVLMRLRESPAQPGSGPSRVTPWILVKMGCGHTFVKKSVRGKENRSFFSCVAAQEEQQVAATLSSADEAPTHQSSKESAGETHEEAGKGSAGADVDARASSGSLGLSSSETLEDNSYTELTESQSQSQSQSESQSQSQSQSQAESQSQPLSPSHSTAVHSPSASPVPGRLGSLPYHRPQRATSLVSVILFSENEFMIQEEPKTTENGESAAMPEPAAPSTTSDSNPTPSAIDDSQSEWISTLPPIPFREVDADFPVVFKELRSRHCTVRLGSTLVLGLIPCDGTSSSQSAEEKKYHIECAMDRSSQSYVMIERSLKSAKKVGLNCIRETKEKPSKAKYCGTGDFKILKYFAFVTERNPLCPNPPPEEKSKPPKAEAPVSSAKLLKYLTGLNPKEKRGRKKKQPEESDETKEEGKGTPKKAKRDQKKEVSTPTKQKPRQNGHHEDSGDETDEDLSITDSSDDERDRRKKKNEGAASTSRKRKSSASTPPKAPATKKQATNSRGGSARGPSLRSSNLLALSTAAVEAHLACEEEIEDMDSSDEDVLQIVSDEDDDEDEEHTDEETIEANLRRYETKSRENGSASVGRGQGSRGRGRGRGRSKATESEERNGHEEKSEKKARGRPKGSRGRGRGRGRGSESKDRSKHEDETDEEQDPIEVPEEEQTSNINSSASGTTDGNAKVKAINLVEDSEETQKAGTESTPKPAGTANRPSTRHSKA